MSDLTSTAIARARAIAALEIIERDYVRGSAAALLVRGQIDALQVQSNRDRIADGLSVGVRMRYASGETGEVCWLDDKWVLAYQDTPCRTPRMYHRASTRPEKTK